MPVQLTSDMKAVIQAAHLCFAATVTADGRPNLSPKGTIRVWDDTSLFFLDIASPGTRANLAARPWMELNVVDQLSRRGYRFAGPAALQSQGAVFDEGCRRIFGEEGAKYPVAGVVLLQVETTAPLISPGYLHVADEPAMRAMWKELRAALDREFETFIERLGPFPQVLTRPRLVSHSFRTYVLEQLRRIRPDVRDRSMFGGVGIYAGDLFFALIAEDTLYFKVDDSNRPAFEERGMGPFMPYGLSGEVMQYYEVPVELLEDPDRLSSWVEQAIEVARNKRTKKRSHGGK